MWIGGATLIRQMVYDGFSNLIWDQVAGGQGDATYADLASTATGKGAALVGFLQSGAGAVTRTVLAKDRDVVSVKDFGAKGDGSTNDTAAIQAADTYARSIGAVAYFPGATYMVSQLVLNTNSTWIGDGRNNTIIKQIIGSNTDLIYALNSNANYGSSSPTGVVAGFCIKGITLNGNWNAGAGNTLGSGISAYAARPILRDVFITNVAEYGMRTEYTDNAAGVDTFTMEGAFDNVRIDTVGKHGWWNNGPHDSVSNNVVVVDAGQATTNTWDGLYYDAKSGGRNLSMHAWSRSASNRMRYALNLISGATHEFSGGCNFEGAYTANMRLASSGCLFDSTTRWYAAWNGMNIMLAGSCASNVIKGIVQGPGSGRPASVGLSLGSVAGDAIIQNDIDLLMVAQEAGNITWTAYDSGLNTIRLNCYNTTTSTYNGAVNAYDNVQMILKNSGGTTRVNNQVQSGTLALTANAESTFNFPYGFTAAPVCTFSVSSPSAAFAAGAWIAALGSTSVTIYNNNAVTATAQIVAVAPPTP